MSRFFFVAKNAFSTSKCFQKVKNQGLKKTLSALPGKKNINEIICVFLLWMIHDPAPSYAGYCKTTFSVMLLNNCQCRIFNISLLQFHTIFIKCTILCGQCELTP